MNAWKRDRCTAGAVTQQHRHENHRQSDCGQPDRAVTGCGHELTVSLSHETSGLVSGGDCSPRHQLPLRLWDVADSMGGRASCSVDSRAVRACQQDDEGDTPTAKASTAALTASTMKRCVTRSPSQSCSRGEGLVGGCTRQPRSRPGRDARRGFEAGLKRWCRPGAGRPHHECPSDDPQNSMRPAILIVVVMRHRVPFAWRRSGDPTAALGVPLSVANCYTCMQSDTEERRWPTTV